MFPSQVEQHVPKEGFVSHCVTLETLRDSLKQASDIKESLQSNMMRFDLKPSSSDIRKGRHLTKLLKRQTNFVRFHAKLYQETFSMISANLTLGLFDPIRMSRNNSPKAKTLRVCYDFMVGLGHLTKDVGYNFHKSTWTKDGIKHDSRLTIYRLMTKGAMFMVSANMFKETDSPLLIPIKPLISVRKDPDRPATQAEIDGIMKIREEMLNELERIQQKNAETKMTRSLYVTEIDKGSSNSIRICDGSITLRNDEKVLTRAFINDFNTGGRFYSNPATLPKIVRATIKFNDEGTSEADFSAVHPNMLYSLCDEDKSRPHDMYKIRGLSRSDAKKVISTLNGCRNNPISAINSAKNNPNIKKCDRVQSTLSAAEIWERVLEVHEPIAHMFATDNSVYLQNLDSQIALHVMLYFVDVLDEAIIPIHDSFIVRASMENELRAAMVRAYQEVMNTDFVIGIK